MKVRFKYVTGICAALLLAAIVSGQPLAFRVMQMENSPELGDASTAAEDSTGMIWLPGRNGLWRFDGSHFDRFLTAKDAKGKPVLFAHLTHVLLSKSRPHWLWLASEVDGLWGLDFTTGQTEYYRHDPLNENTPGGNRITWLFESEDGTLWFTDENYNLNRLYQGTVRRFRPPDFPQVLPVSEERNLLGALTADGKNPDWFWIGSRFGLYRFDKKVAKFDFFAFPIPLPYYYDGLIIHLFTTKDGTVWAGSNNSGLLKFDSRTGLFKVINFDIKDLVPTTILDIQRFDEHRLMVFASSSGRFKIWLYDPLAGSSESFLPSGVATGIGAILLRNQKSSGAYPSWWVREPESFSRLTRSPPRFKFESFGPKNPALRPRNWQRAYCLTPDKRFLLMGTLNGQGILKWDWKRDTIIIIAPKRKAGKPEPLIWYDDLFYDPDGKTLWVGTDKGLMVSDGESEVRFFSKSGNEPSEITYHITSVYADEKTIWLGTANNGIFIVDKKTRQKHALFNPDTPLGKKFANVRRIFCDSRKRIWIGSDFGLLGMKGPSETQILEVFSGENNQGPALPIRRVNNIVETSDGKLWLATYGGLCCLDPDGPVETRLTVYNNTENNLANYINDLVVSQTGDLLLATEANLTVFRPSSGTFINFNSQDGENDRLRIIFQLPDGRCISGARFGINVFDPKNFIAGPPPTIYWRDFRIFDHPSAEAAHLNTATELLLQPGENHFSFEFGAVNFEENAQNRFAYQLEGYDRDWVATGNRTFANYTNLQPGEYHFRVKAANRFGVWSPTRSIGVVILPPFYKTFWFTFLCCLFLGLIVWLIIRAWRARQQSLNEVRRKEEELRELDKRLAESELIALKAQMNPHFLFNCLNSINWYIVKNRPLEASKYLTKFSRLIRLILDNSKYQKIPLESELETLRLYIEMEGIRFEEKFEFEIHVSPDLETEEIKISPMILQPYVENAIWHGLMPLNGLRPGLLRIGLTREGDHLQCTIEDNGIGREAAMLLQSGVAGSRVSRGMNITAERISILNQQEKGDHNFVQIIDLKNEKGEAYGTRVVLKLPLESGAPS